MTGSTKIKTATVLALALLFLAANSSLAADGTFETSLTVPEGTSLDVDTGSGSIVVTAGSGREARITGKIRITRRSDREDADKSAAIIQALNDEPPVELKNDRLSVGRIQDRDLRKKVTISYEIAVPADTEVVADSGSGAIAISGIAASVEADTGSGSIKLEDIGSSAKASTGSGSIRAEGIAGAFKASSGSGSISMTQTAPGDVNVSTGSGSTKLAGVVGSLRASSGSGRITVDGRQEGDWKIDNGSGSIRVTLPADSAFSLDAESHSGGITIDHPLTVSGKVDKHRLRGDVRGGGPLLRIGSGSGGIRIEESD